MTIERWTTCLIATFAIASPAPIDSQPLDVVWEVKPTARFEADDGAAHGVYGSDRDIEIEFTISNEGPEGQWVIVQPGFFSNLRIVLAESTSGRARASVKQWDETARCGGAEAATECSTKLETVLKAGGWITATASMAGDASRPVAAGDYRIEVSLSAARVWLRNQNVEPWTAPLLTEGSVPLVVRRPVTPVDRRRSLALEAGRAMTRKEYQTAFELYTRMSSEFSNDPTGPAGVGTALLRLGRFEEAATWFQRGWALGVKAESTLPADLALAYIASGREERAVATLQRYYSQNAVQEMMTALRAQATRLRPRP